MAVYTDRWPRAYALNTVTELELTTSQNIAENYTRVNYVVRVKKINNWNDNWTPSGGSYLTLSIGGKAVRSNHRSSWTTANNSSNSTAIVDSGHVNVPHNADGTKTIDYRMTLKPNVRTVSTIPDRVISGSFRANTIPRASDFTINSYSLTTGSNYTVSIKRHSTSFTHRVYRRIGGKEVELTTYTVAESRTINMPHSLFNDYPSSDTISASIVVKTFNGSRQIGSTSKNVTIRLIDTARPANKAATLSVSDNRPFTEDDNKDRKQIIRGVSRLTLKAEGVAGSYNSRISSYEFSYQYTGGTWISTTTNTATHTYPAFSFPSSGSVYLNIRSRVKDSRGRYSDWVTEWGVARVHYYEPPSIGGISLRRARSNNTTIQVYRSHSVTPLYVDADTTKQRNTASLRFQTRELGEENFYPNGGGESTSLSTSAGWINLLGGFNAGKSYQVRAALSDGRRTVLGSWVNIGTEFVPLDIGPKGIGVGKMHEAGGATLQVDGDIEVSGGLNVAGQHKPWSPLSVQGGLVKDFNYSAIFAVKNGVGYVKFHNVFLNRVHTGAPFQVSRVPSEYAPSRDMHVALAPAYWETNVNKRMILEVRTNGEIWCIRNTHAGTMMTSDAIALI